MHKRLAAVSVLLLTAWRCPGGSSSEGVSATKHFAGSFVIDQAAARADLDFIAAEPHPFGSARQSVVADYLARRASEARARTFIQKFDADIPNPRALFAPAELTRKVSGRNVFAWPDRWNDSVARNSGGRLSCVVMFGSHYDTKHVEGIRYTGANDSGSSSVALLQMLRHLADATPPAGLQCGFVFVWFDGEESTLPEWDGGETNFPVRIVDHTWGSRHAAGKVGPAAMMGEESGAKAAVKLSAMVLLDMVGSPDLRLTDDLLSNSAMRELKKVAVQGLGLPAGTLSGYSVPVEDDHKPFLDIGVPALNIIDFNDVSVWHREGDEPARVNPKSIEKSIKIALFVAHTVAIDPQAIR
jgi:hypothetical protein